MNQRTLVPLAIDFTIFEKDFLFYIIKHQVCLLDAQKYKKRFFKK